jgi:hypothetical protein
MEARHCCPDCGSIDLVVTSKGLLGADGKSLSRATCPNCAWEGPLKDTIGLATTEQVWTTERIAEVMLRVSSKHAAGPLIQLLEYIGLVPAMQEGTSSEARGHNDIVQLIRDRVARSTFEGMVTAAFEEAAHCHKAYAVAYDKPLHPVLRDDEEIFGGGRNGRS